MENVAMMGADVFAEDLDEALGEVVAQETIQKLQGLMLQDEQLGNQLTTIEQARADVRLAIEQALNILQMDSYILDDGQAQILKALRYERKTMTWNTEAAKEAVNSDMFNAITSLKIDQKKVEALLTLKKIRSTTVDKFRQVKTFAQMRIGRVDRPKTKKGA